MILHRFIKILLVRASVICQETCIQSYHFLSMLIVWCRIDPPCCLAVHWPCVCIGVIEGVHLYSVGYAVFDF